MNSKERWEYAKHHYNAKEVDWGKMPQLIVFLAWLKFLIMHPIATIKETFNAMR